MLNTYKQQFAQNLANHLPLSVEEIIEMIELAPDNIKGDFAFPCFKLSKTLGKAPNLIAQETVEKIGTPNIIQIGPYINYVLESEQLANNILSKIQQKKADFGKGADTHKEILIEGRQPNTHKAVHIGHVRNILVSESVARILKFAGNKVIKCCYPGDIGAHVAKWMWYYINFYEGEMPTKDFTKWVGQLYTQATLKVDENSEEYKAQIEKLQKELEDGDPELTKIRLETRQLCLDDMKNIFAELGSGDIDKRYFESEVEKPGIKIVQDMLEKGIAAISQGATVIDLEPYNLGTFLLLKSTGASLYSTKDIGLAYKKKSDYPTYNLSLYVVGSEQEHHFAQLFKTLELIGFSHEELTHLSYGLIDLKEGKMSSRAGNVILYEDFRDRLLAKAEELVSERNLPDEKKKEIAHAVAFGAMKFGILLQDSEKKILFDQEQALSFEGETGPYIQYTYARINSILKKNTFPLENINYNLLNNEEEKKLLLQLAKLPEEVQKAASSFKPNYVARFCLDLAQLFSSYYHGNKIIDESNPELSKARIVLSQSIQQALKNGLDLLGIDVVDQM